jgi:hypothetical protein
MRYEGGLAEFVRRILDWLQDRADRRSPCCCGADEGGHGAVGVRWWNDTYHEQMLIFNQTTSR